MAPPSKRRKLLEPSQIVAQQSEAATKSSLPPFSHGVEHIPATKSTQSLYARPTPAHVEEVHLAIHKKSVPSVEERRRILRRQGTAALSNIISTNSDADVVVAVTAMVDALGSTTALTTAAVTVDIPDLSSLLSTSTTTAVISDASAEPTTSSAQETLSSNAPSSAQETSARPTSSTGEESSAESASPTGSSRSETASASNDSSSSDTPSSTSASGSSTSSGNTSLPSYVVSPALENGTDSDPQNESQAETSSESGTGSSVVPSSTTGTAPASSGTSSSRDTATLESSTSSNSSVPISTSASSQSQTSQTVISATTSGFSGQTGSASSMNSLNLTTSASTWTSGSVVLVSDFTINYASSTSETNTQATDSISSIDLNLLYLATQSNGEVETMTKSDEPFTTSLSDGQQVVVPPSSTAASNSRTSDASVSGSVTTISNDQTTVQSTVFLTASASSTQDSSDASNGVGFAGIAGDGATGTSNGISSTSAAADNNGDDEETAPAGTIAGGVVGGAAGLALVALIVLLFLRRYKKRAQLGHLALPANAAGPVTGTGAGSSSGGPGMAERAGLMPFAGVVPAIFRHQSRSQHSGSETGERGFQRVAGRKLPSAFSEGMTGPPHSPTSPPPSMPLVDNEGPDRNLSSHSFYRDSAGFYGGDGSVTSPNPFSDTNLPATVAGGEAAEQMIMSPGPQRRPTIHVAKSNVAGPSVATSGTPSWTPSHTAAFARSDTPASLDSGRNSRFTEEV